MPQVWTLQLWTLQQGCLLVRRAWRLGLLGLAELRRWGRGLVLSVQGPGQSTCPPSRQVLYLGRAIVSPGMQSAAVLLEVRVLEQLPLHRQLLLAHRHPQLAYSQRPVQLPVRPWQRELLAHCPEQLAAHQRWRSPPRLAVLLCRRLQALQRPLQLQFHRLRSGRAQWQQRTLNASSCRSGQGHAPFSSEPFWKKCSALSYPCVALRTAQWPTC